MQSKTSAPSVHDAKKASERNDTKAASQRAESPDNKMSSVRKVNGEQLTRSSFRQPQINRNMNDEVEDIEESDISGEERAHDNINIIPNSQVNRI